MINNCACIHKEKDEEKGRTSFNSPIKDAESSGYLSSFIIVIENMSVTKEKYSVQGFHIMY